MRNLEEGAKVVHKAHGVGTICGVETLLLGGVSQDYYLLKIDASGLVVRFPTVSGSHQVRGLVDEKEIREVYEILGSPPRNYSMVWNRRKKEFLDKIKSGSLFEIAEVLRDLSRLGDGKELSFGEKEMLEKARERIINEISAARSQTSKEVGDELDQYLCH